MTVKLNLSPLIKHFSDKNPTMAQRLHSLTKTAGKPNNSQFKKLAQALTAIADELDQTDPELATEADQILRDLIKQAGCSNMEMGHEHSEKCMGMAPAGVTLLVDEPGHGDHQMGHSPDDEMLDVDNLKGEGRSIGLEGIGLHSSDSPHGSSMSEEDEGQSNILDQLESVEQGRKNWDRAKNSEGVEPSLEELSDPEPEYDTVTLDDLKDRLDNMKWRVSDRKGREALEQAISHIERAQQHHGAKETRLRKAHELFDGAGLALRVKDFE